MRKSKYLGLIFVPATSVFAACGGPADDNDPMTFGSAEIHLTAAPSDVYCVRVQAQGSRFQEKTVDVVPGQSTVFTMTGLPTGNVTFSGDAFNQACSMIAGATPTWIADPVATSIQSSVVAQVSLNMKRNGQANVSVDFEPDPTTSCADGVQNGTETGVDCGGGACMPCPIGAGCLVAADCIAPSVCQNGVCTTGSLCMVNADCPAGFVCQNGACTTSTTCHVVINEVQPVGMSGSPNDNFVELYNPCMTGVDLTNYGLLYRTPAGTTDLGVAMLSGMFIPPLGLLLLASDGYTGPGPIDVAYPSFPLQSSGGGLGLVELSTNVVADSVGWGNATNAYVESSPAPTPPIGQTIARIPNGVDTNNNQIDFLVTFPTPHMPN